MGGQHQVWPGHFTRVAALSGPRPDIWQPHCLSLADAQGREGHIKLPSDTMTAGAYSGSNTAGGLQRMSCCCSVQVRGRVHPVHRS